MIFMLSLVLYIEKEYGGNRELQDFSNKEILPAPEWAREGILYQVFPRVFTQEGTFRAMQEKLDRIQKLGIDIIWLKPIFPIGVKGRKGTLGSSYSIKDFKKINPDYGTEADFKSLVNAIHHRNMKVIIGMVPNHGSNDNILMTEHPNWFKQDSFGNFVREAEDWSDVTDFNYDDPHMRNYMKETLVYWVREFGIDGFRCDVAGMVPYDFWSECLKSLREIKPDIFLLAEWEDPELLVQGFNSDYDWTLYHLLKDIREGKNETAEAVELIHQKDSFYPQNSLPMRFLENHDELRSLRVFKKGGIKAYATFLFTLPGIPLIYAGQEIGENVKPSLFEKNELNWAKADNSLLRMYQDLIQLRKSHSCLTSGDFRPLQTETNRGSAGAFIRKNNESLALVVCNLGSIAADKVSIILPDDLNKLQKLELINYENSADKISLSNLRFERIEPLTTLVYKRKV